MRLLFTTIVILSAWCFAEAQVKEVPMPGNEALRRAAALDHTKRYSGFSLQADPFNHAAALEKNDDCGTPQLNTYYLYPGDTLHLKVDTIAIGGGSFELTGCNQYGTTGIDSTTYIYYASDAAQSLVTDSVCVRVCSADTCRLLSYYVITRRHGQSFDIPQVILGVQQDTVVCVDTTSLEGSFACNTAYQLNPGTGKYFIAKPDCIFYESSRFHGTDTLTFVLCDNYTVCDTFRLPFLVRGDTIGLPFMDDFSYEGPYPDPHLWADDNVFVNNDWAIDPPSVGFASFDGLDHTGSPYGGVGTSGKADELTSAYLDLSPYLGNSVYLSFYTQPGGLVYPAFKKDSLVMEFKNNLGNWVEIDTFQGVPNSTSAVPSFKYHIYPISDPQFMYNGFQFRFKNYCNLANAYGPWHLDYVRLDEVPHSDSTFEDIAFTQLPKSILRNYTSMPWRHLKGIEETELRDSLEVNVYNHFPFVASINDSKASLDEVLTTGIPAFNPPFVLNTGNVNNGEHIKTNKEIIGLLGYLNTMKNDFPEDDSLEFLLKYVLVNQSQANLQSVMRNDTVSRKTVFYNYFSYDDGTAEHCLIAQYQSTQVAVQYQATVDDSLYAVQMMIPHFQNDASGQLFNLHVWLDSLDNTPEYEATLLKPYYPDRFMDTLQAFTTFVLTDDLTGENKPLYVPAGKFYIGWQQASQNDFEMPVGLDQNNPEAGKYLYEYFNGQWNSLEGTVGGALMMRPVMGFVHSTQEVVSTHDKPLAEQIDIYPNPVSDQLQIRLREGNYADYTVSLFNVAGQQLLSQGLNASLSVRGLDSGVYFLTIAERAGKGVMHQKVVVVR